MTGNCEKCKTTTTEGIVVEGQLAGIYKVLAKVSGLDVDAAMSITVDYAIEEFGDASKVVESGATVQMPLWVCGDCAASTGYKVGPMGTAVYREGAEGMGEVF